MSFLDQQKPIALKNLVNEKFDEIVSPKNHGNNFCEKVAQRIQKLFQKEMLFETSLNLLADDEIDVNQLLYSAFEKIQSENCVVQSDQLRFLDGYFECIQFLKISDYYRSSYRYFVEIIDNDIIITLSCLDASTYILDTIKRRSKGTVFFSATLEPIDYHVQLITSGEGKSISIPSPFFHSVIST